MGAVASITVADVLTDGELDLVAAAAIAILVAAYVRGLLRFDQRHDRSWPTVRVAWFGGAVACLLLATQTGIGRYGHDRMTVHMVQHLLIGMVAPFALVRAAPVTLALQAGAPGTRRAVRRALRSRTVRLLTRPAVTWLLFGGGMVVVYLTPLLERSVHDPVVHALVHLHFFVAGCLFLVGLVGVDRLAHPIPFGGRLLSTLTAVPFHAFLGVVLLSSTTPVAADAYPSLSDQRTAAGLLWVMGELFSVAVAAVVLRDWFRAEERAGARHDRRVSAAGARPARPAPGGDPRRTAAGRAW